LPVEPPVEDVATGVASAVVVVVPLTEGVSPAAVPVVAVASPAAGTVAVASVLAGVLAAGTVAVGCAPLSQALKMSSMATQSRITFFDFIVTLQYPPWGYSV